MPTPYTKHAATKLAITTERIFEQQVIDLIKAEGAKGWTIFEGGGNSPLHLHPSAQPALVDAFHIIKIEVILLDSDNAEHIATRLMDELFTDLPGIVTLTDVSVLRPQKF